MIKTALYVLLNLFVLASEEKKESEPGKVEPSEEPSTSDHSKYYIPPQAPVQHKDDIIKKRKRTRTPQAGASGSVEVSAKKPKTAAVPEPKEAAPPLPRRSQRKKKGNPPQKEQPNQ